MKELKKTVFVQTTEQMTLQDLAYKISEVVEHDDAATFIALLEKSYQSWEVTEALINHFDNLRKVYKKEFPENERELKPKDLLESQS